MPGAALFADKAVGRPIKIAVVAGEASGDFLGAELVRGLLARVPDASIFGIAGPRMISAGVACLFPAETLAVRGYVEVLRHYRSIVAIRRQLTRELLREPPDVFVGIDAPDFNLPLETALKQAGIPTVHYVSPSIWAWRGERIHAIGKAVSRMLTIFPFEARLYEEARIPVTYVGHPLVELLPSQPDRMAARDQLRLPATAPVIALLPGSRQSEVAQLAGLFLGVGQEVIRQWPDARFLVPLVSRETRDLFERSLYRGDGSVLPVTMLFGHAHEAMIAADIVLAASGTATLEAALLKRPMVIAYRMPQASWWMMRRKKYLPYVGLPNILAGEFVVPEFLQADATVKNIAQAVCNLLSDPTTRGRIERSFDSLRAQFAGGSSAADAVLTTVQS